MDDNEKMDHDINTSIMLLTCAEHPEIYNKIGNILYKFYGKPAGAELTLVCTYVYIKMKGGENNVEI